ncbi:DUF402 domain-containing protein [Thermoflavimicrobium dichotomicum]|uniref:DUF402 domain-containing protein n=1 Tax=Thermoflavimicrobium dichotomicum TaxID=46223 RepID=A0A1I3JEA7_9BACL|nr:DUF402 domain-containing protein [Thermoflavimicrobium dichotomicum]SFI58583.1 hypothetical protein SAMN05421852_10140 [Thermoflavimicrobium dichotomicum]
MKLINRGDVLQIRSLKYPDRFHRLWKESVVLQNDDPLIAANYNVEVLENGGEKWFFQGLAICVFSRHEWFNTIMLYDEQGNLNRYYCNIASPYQLDPVKKQLTYIDYDIDFVVDPTLQYRLADVEEYVQNRVRFSYPEMVLIEVGQAVEALKMKIELKEPPFHPDFAKYWYKSYLSLKRGDELME